MTPADASAQIPGFFTMSLVERDPELARAVGDELRRQQDQIELIASENIVSAAVLEAQGSVLTNKYAEGYPSKRYYGGCEYVDIAEALAIDRAKKLFACNFANVQPHSGAQANQAAFMALLQPGDTFMGLNLAAGGHLTHGSPVNQSGKWFKVVPYNVRPREPADRHGRGRETGEGAQAEADPGRRVRLSALLGFRALPQDRGFHRRLFHVRHGAFLRGWSRAACIRARCLMRMWSPPRPTRRCGGRAAA